MPFVETDQGSCGSETPCGHSHSGIRIRMLVSKPTEGAGTVQYIVYNTGTATVYNVDLWDNIFGTHLQGPWNLAVGVNTGWGSHTTTSSRLVLVFWCTTSSCTDQHWDGLNY